MVELIKSIRLMGLPHMLKMQSGYRAGWKDMIGGYIATPIMHALLNIGFIDEIAAKGDADPAEFAAARNLDGFLLNALCEAFYEMEFFRKTGSRYGLDEKGQLVFDVLRGWFEVSYGYREVFANLEPMLRKEMIYGKDFYRKSDYVAKGSGEMENWLFFPLANEIINEHGFTKVMDLGCGDGTFLRKLCQLNPKVQAFGIDLAPQAVEDGKRRSAEAGLADRIQLFAEDISNLKKMPEPMQGLEAATIFFVLHELLYTSEERVIQFLKDFRRLFPKVPLIAFEAIRPTPDEMRARQGISIYYFLYHDLSQQKPVGLAKWHELFRAAGFESIEERYLEFTRTAIFTVV